MLLKGKPLGRSRRHGHTDGGVSANPCSNHASRGIEAASEHSTAQHSTPSDEKPQVYPESPAPGPLQTEEWKLDYFWVEILIWEGTYSWCANKLNGYHLTIPVLPKVRGNVREQIGPTEKCLVIITKGNYIMEGKWKFSCSIFLFGLVNQLLCQRK